MALQSPVTVRILLSCYKMGGDFEMMSMDAFFRPFPSLQNDLGTEGSGTSS